MTTFEIFTPRLRLRDFTPADEAAFVAYRDDPGQGRSLLERFAAWRKAEPRTNFQLAVCRRDEAETLVGCCGLRGEGMAPGIAEYGLELAPTWQGRYRYAIEITEAMFGYGFDTLQLDEIVGKTTEANDRIHRLAGWYGAVLGAHGGGAVEWRIKCDVWRAGPKIRTRPER